MNDRWKNRRRMAWASMIAGMLYPLLVLFTASEQLGAIAGPFYVFIGIVFTAYTAGVVVDDKNHKESK